jgi:IclR family transcriptional regulator, acetate operon repressor
VTEPATTRQPAHPISSVDNALRLLVSLRDREEIRVSEASAELGVARSTAHRMLAMLHSYGLVERSTNRTYRIGPVLAEIGLAALRQVDVRVHIRPFLERLVSELGETAHLIVREGINCRFFESIEGTHALRTTARVGTAYPAQATSGGKALLAELDEPELLELFPSEDLPVYNERSFTSRAALFAQLDEVRAQGYAINRGETELGICAVGMVQRTSSGRIAGALAVSAPEVRASEQRILEFVDVLRRVTGEAQRRLP